MKSNIPLVCLLTFLWHTILRVVMCNRDIRKIGLRQNKKKTFDTVIVICPHFKTRTFTRVHIVKDQMQKEEEKTTQKL